MTTLHIAKENFKFSSAHFLIFDSQSAEMLHGHNYQVKVDVSFHQVLAEKEQSNGQIGYAIDFSILKKYIKAKLDEWDEHVLLPQLHPDMKFKTCAQNKNFEIHFRDRFYSLPQNEVIWLPVTNTSVEQLSKILAQDFFSEFKKYNIIQIQVTVEETRGQSASTIL